MVENIDKFLRYAAQSLSKDTFVKMTLGNYKGTDPQLQKILVRRIETKKGQRLDLQYRFSTRDVSKNYSPDEALDAIHRLLGTDFFAARLFTTETDFQLDISKKGKSRLNREDAAFSSAASADHDRQKTREINPHNYYLNALGITTGDGRVKDKQQDKWRQINKFVEILGAMFDNSPLKDRKSLNIADMGSGKGYLTFAAYDYFKNSRAIDVRVTGVEIRAELVELCNRIAADCGFEQLAFVEGTIENYDPKDADILFALHACDTATDDALYKGITADSQLIIAAPCCHKEVRPQISPPPMLQDVLKHGVMLERTAETVTDGLRSLLLERSGYTTKLFEFVPVEHTPKNNMLVAIKRNSRPRTSEIDAQIGSLKAFYGIKSQRLERLLSKQAISRDT